DLQLLIVLLSEVGAVRANQIEQLQNNRHHALEEARAVHPLHRVRRTLSLDSEPVSTRIKLRGSRHDHLVSSEVCEKRQIAIECTGVSLEILWIIELRWVYEDADNDDFIFSTTLLDQGSVSPMKGSHRGNEANTAPSQGAATVKPLGHSIPNPCHE